jgi:hypothetical protein
MKNVAQILMLILPLGLTSLGGPLQKEQVAADAKWLVHLDVDRLRSTKVGDYIINQVLEPKLGSLTRQFDFNLDWKKVRALTAYGTSFQSKSSFDGVLLIKTELDLQGVLDNAIEKASRADKHSVPIEKTQEGDITTYSMKDQMFASFETGKPVIVGKSLDSIQNARGVLSGTSASLASTKTFSEFPQSPNPFFFMGAVDAFNSSPETAKEPRDGDEFNPKAKILKLADGGRVLLGENSKELFVDLSLKAKSAEVVTQMQQVIQGMIALASLSQSDNQDLQQLAQSAKVSSTGQIVTLKLGYPAEQAVQLLSSNLNKHLEGRGHSDKGDSRARKHRARNNDTPEEPARSDEK